MVNRYIESGNRFSSSPSYPKRQSKNRLAKLNDHCCLRVISGHTLFNRVGTDYRVADCGNDSFGIILPSTRMDEAVVTGLKIRNAISATPIVFAVKAIEVLVSMGFGDEHRRSPRRPLMDRVKDARSAASELGGNRVVAIKGDGFVQVNNSAGRSRKIATVGSR